MTFLIYGIMGTKEKPPHLSMTGVGHQPVKTAVRHSLQAAYSLLKTTPPPMTLESIQTFNAVVGELCRLATTVPLRYGSLCSDHRDIADHLARRGQRYAGLLKRIEGCVEMGIRIDSPAPGPTAPRTDDHQTSEPSPLSGHRYLHRRKKHYATIDESKAALEQMASFYKNAFTGLYREFACEVSAAHTVPGIFSQPVAEALCFYFLIRRKREGAFRQIFDTVRQASANNPKLSGPWPPYNFVVDRGHDALTQLMAQEA